MCICNPILYSFLFFIMLQHHRGSRRKSQRQLTGHNIVCFLLYREPAVTCQDQTFHLTVARNTEFPDKDILCHIIVSVIDYNQALLLFVKSRIGDKIVISRSLFDRACEKLPVFLVDTDHFPVEIDQLLIFMSPWVGSSVIRIGKATDTCFVSVVDRWCARPCHLDRNSLTHDSLIDTLIGCFAAHCVHTTDLFVGSCQKTRMIVVGKLIHRDLQRWRCHRCTVMDHCAPEAVRISV